MTVTAVLVVARMPVPGHAKTRLAGRVGEDVAADIAAAALLDTLEAVTASALPCVVACTGDLSRASRREELAGMLPGADVVPQRGVGFAERLVSAHHDAAELHPGHRVLQIGMDTPQLTPDLLWESAAMLASYDAVLGPATDGGWWVLGVRAPALADGLVDVPMSDPRTGRATREMLEARGAQVGRAPDLTDVDTLDDALRVADLEHCGRRFAAAVNGLRGAGGRGTGRQGEALE